MPIHRFPALVLQNQSDDHLMILAIPHGKGLAPNADTLNSRWRQH